MVWMLYDNNLQLVLQGSGAKRVTEPRRIKANSAVVNFDNFLITYMRGKTRQINEYYPYGMSNRGLNGYSNEYPYEYQGKEYQDGEVDADGIEMYEYDARFYEPALGSPDGFRLRLQWFVPDPATERACVCTEQFHNPYLAMGNNPAMAQPATVWLMYVDPDGEFIISMFIGAGISVITNAINNAVEGGDLFEGADVAALTGAIGGVIASGIGGVANGLSGMDKVVFQTLAHGNLGSGMSSMAGGDPGAGFLSGAFGSLAATGTELTMKNVQSDFLNGAATVGVGSLSAGVGAELSGGNFWDGARNGAISAGLNHAAHSFGQNGDPPEGGVDGWKTFSGIAATAGGITMIAGGVLAAVTPGGQILAIYLISTGAVVTGFGAATTIDGLDGGHRKDLGGPAYTIERRIGGDGTVGEIVDLGLSGYPITNLNKVILGANVLSSGTVRSVFQSNNNNAIHFQNDFFAQPDNTRVDLNLNRYYR